MDGCPLVGPHRYLDVVANRVPFGWCRFRSQSASRPGQEADNAGRHRDCRQLMGIRCIHSAGLDRESGEANSLVLAVLVVSLAATILTCRWFAVVRPRAHWRAVKLWSLWGLAAAAAALLQSNLGPGDITLETGLLSPPIAVLIVITWTWWTAREQRRA